MFESSLVPDNWYPRMRIKDRPIGPELKPGDTVKWYSRSRGWTQGKVRELRIFLQRNWRNNTEEIVQRAYVYPVETQRHWYGIGRLSIQCRGLVKVSE